MKLLTKRVARWARRHWIISIFVVAAVASILGGVTFQAGHAVFNAKHTPPPKGSGGFNPDTGFSSETEDESNKRLGRYYNIDLLIVDIVPTNENSKEIVRPDIEEYTIAKLRDEFRNKLGPDVVRVITKKTATQDEMARGALFEISINDVESKADQIYLRSSHGAPAQKVMTSSSGPVSTSEQFHEQLNYIIYLESAPILRVHKEK